VAVITGAAATSMRAYFASPFALMPHSRASRVRGRVSCSRTRPPSEADGGSTTESQQQTFSNKGQTKINADGKVKLNKKYSPRQQAEAEELESYQTIKYIITYHISGICTHP